MRSRLPASLRALSALPLFRLAAASSGVFFTLGIVLILAKVPPPAEGGIVPLYYNIYFGVDQIGRWWQLFIPSGLILALSVVNALFAGHWWTREPVLSYAFGVLTVLLHALLFLHIIFIVLLNLSYV